MYLSTSKTICPLLHTFATKQQAFPFSPHLLYAFLCFYKVVSTQLYSPATRKTTAEQTFSTPDAAAKIWELSAREQDITQTLNSQSNQSPCAAP